MMKILVICLVLCTQICCANSFYLCGGDEDGCPPDDYAACICVPVNPTQADQAYCLNFDNLSCASITGHQNCSTGIVVKGQGRCLALAYQSEQTPGCPKVSEQFCHQHHVAVCNDQGEIASCHVIN